MVRSRTHLLLTAILVLTTACAPSLVALSKDRTIEQRLAALEERVESQQKWIMVNTAMNFISIAGIVYTGAVAIPHAINKAMNAAQAGP